MNENQLEILKQMEILAKRDGRVWLWYAAVGAGVSDKLNRKETEEVLSEFCKRNPDWIPVICEPMYSNSNRYFGRAYVDKCHCE